jgi:predicted transcriptional regulator
LEEVHEKENPRANITARKYKKQIDWRRFKVRELLIREHSQYEISQIMHISQPTVSTDIDFIHKQYKLNPDNYSNNLVTEYVKISLSIEEILQKLWKIVDDNRINIKDRLRAISHAKRVL